VLAICEGHRSATREYFAGKFGRADESIYSLNGEHLQDIVLGLRVKSALPDPMSVLLTVAQNRYLLNSVRGEGFLNMRLTDAEANEVMAAGLDPGSGLWQRVLEGLTLFGVAETDLSSVTAFRMDLVQRPRFTAQLLPPTSATAGTHGFLLGDAANAIHFWPGRGLNSGLASAISLARCLSRAWRERPFRDADFVRHEAAMSMLQYRHKSRAWKAMVITDEHGAVYAVKDKIAQSIERAAAEESERRDTVLDALTDRLREIRGRLASRVPDLPDDAFLADHLRRLKPETLRTLLESGAWDTVNSGGEEVDIDILY
jgi:2-polyprenyl-6-methoxyphenol hydroxylase-like FAD-dependent oxidoreductase